MVGLLDTSFIRDLMGDVMSSIYGDGTLIRVDMVKQPGGTLLPVVQEPEAVKVQVDSATEAMRLSQGYTATDVAIYILQSGVSGRKPNTNDRVIAYGEECLIADVTEDPARSYWLMRGIKKDGS